MDPNTVDDEVTVRTMIRRAKLKGWDFVREADRVCRLTTKYQRVLEFQKPSKDNPEELVTLWVFDAPGFGLYGRIFNASLEVEPTQVAFLF